MAGNGDVVLAVLARAGAGVAGQTNSATTPDLFLPTSGDRPSCAAMVERRDGPSWLRDDDDDIDGFFGSIMSYTNSHKPRFLITSVLVTVLSQSCDE